MAEKRMSLLQYSSSASSFDCSYCGMENGKTEFQVDAHFLTFEDYNNFLDAGFHRGGNSLHTVVMEKTCCPIYELRVEADKFHLSRSQKKVLKNMNNFLKFGHKPKNVAFSSSGKVKNDVAVGQQSPLVKANKHEFTETNRVKGMKKKEIRKQRAIKRRLERGEDIDKYQEERRLKELNRRRTLQSFVGECDYSTQKMAHKLEIRTITVDSIEFKESLNESFEVYSKYQDAVHDKHSTMQWYNYRFNNHSAFEHCRPQPSNDKNMVAFGVYHSQYLLNGKIIAVGLIVILPRGICSEYFFYDPDYSFLNLGTYSALREIACIQRLSKILPSMRYYYLGDYVLNCDKLIYKERFKPCQLLCNRTLKWMPLENAVKKIIANDFKYTEFYPEDPALPIPGFDSILLVSNDRTFSYSQLRAHISQDLLEDYDTRMNELLHFYKDLVKTVAFAVWPWNGNFQLTMQRRTLLKIEILARRKLLEKR